MAEVRNMRLYETDDGKNCRFPPIFTAYWYPCINIPDSAGATELPTILKKVVIPRDAPLFCLGIESMITF
jgi:hypothetical protein